MVSRFRPFYCIQLFLLLSIISVRANLYLEKKIGISSSENARDTALVFYVDSEKGSDLNSGNSPENAWQTLDRVSQQTLIPGDSILLKSGQEFFGTLKIQANGTHAKPIVFGKYEGVKYPIINSAGYLAGVYFTNSSNIIISNLEITSNGGTAKELEAQNKRYGIYAVANNAGEYANIHIVNLNIHHIFASESVESDGQNATSNMGYGVSVNVQNQLALVKNVYIENCEIYMTGHTGIRVFGNGNWPEVNYIDSVSILNNKLEQIGGPGMVPGKCQNVLVSGNIVNYSGSSADARMHNRGSGIWPWTCRNVIIENNKFMHAWGKYDSCGAHIDFNCTNVIIQYNLSVDNAGGFVEILGNDSNCVYRYNISINDGYRKKGLDGALSDGHMFWLSNYTGQKGTPIGANNCRIYNNTIYIGPDISTNITLAYGTNSNQFFNNIIYADGSLSYSNQGENNSFDNNIYLGNIAKLPFGEGAIFADPQFINPGDINPDSYKLKENSPAINTGMRIKDNAETDFWGDSISDLQPIDRGADETGIQKLLYTIEASAETEGGEIYPSGKISISENTDIPFQIIPKQGFEIEMLLVDGLSVETSSIYTFSELNAGHTIHVEFYSPADSITDPLNNFNIAMGYSSNMKIQNENPDNFILDSARVVRIDTNPGYLIYNFKEITNVKVNFWEVSDDNSSLKIYTSSDGIDFTEVTKKVNQYNDFGYRSNTIYTTWEKIDPGINFIKLEVTGSDAAWKAQIGSVSISWLGDELTSTQALLGTTKNIKIYPNPVESRLYLAGLEKAKTVEIISTEGKRSEFKLKGEWLDVSTLMPGIYLLRIDGYATMKFVK